jgi:GNAT superfamily N-acetyltransferase
MMMRCVRTLTPAEWPAYEAHLLRLDVVARRLRFGYQIDDRAIRAHVASLIPARDRILAVVEGGRVVAAAHIASAVAQPGINAGAVEFAFSVDADRRGQGFGRLLFDQALAWSRNRGLRRAAIYFLSDNHAMRRLASRAGMSVEGRAGEYEGVMPLPPATPFSLARELAAERWALWEEQGRRQLPRLLVARPAF